MRGLFYSGCSSQPGIITVSIPTPGHGISLIVSTSASLQRVRPNRTSSTIKMLTIVFLFIVPILCSFCSSRCETSVYGCTSGPVAAVRVSGVSYSQNRGTAVQRADIPARPVLRCGPARRPPPGPAHRKTSLRASCRIFSAFLWPCAHRRGRRCCRKPCGYNAFISPARAVRRLGDSGRSAGHQVPD